MAALFGPAIAVRRTASLRSPMTQISTLSVHREAVQQAVAAGALEIVLAAAAARAARRVRGVPRFRCRVVAQALAVVMTEHGGALRAAGPVAAGAVFVRREGTAIGGRTCRGIRGGVLFSLAAERL